MRNVSRGVSFLFNWTILVIPQRREEGNILRWDTSMEKPFTSSKFWHQNFYSIGIWNTQKGWAGFCPLLSRSCRGLFRGFIPFLWGYTHFLGAFSPSLRAFSLSKPVQTFPNISEIFSQFCENVDLHNLPLNLSGNDIFQYVTKECVASKNWPKKPLTLKK